MSFLKRGRSKYVVLESDGAVLRHYGVVGVDGYNEGLVMRYKNSEGKVDMVLVGRNYRFLEENGQFFVGKRLGNNSACKLADGTEVERATDVVGMSSDPDCPGEDLSALGRSDFMAVGIKTLYGQSAIPWKWIIIGALVIGVILFVYKFHDKLGF